jgi:hypothetical protein
VAAKLVVTAREGGSRIALVGASGKELLASVVFTEPRAKGATLRALKGMLGDNIVVEDHTLASPRGRTAAAATTNGTTTKRVAKATRRPATRRRAKASTGDSAVTEVTKATKATKSAAKS